MSNETPDQPVSGEQPTPITPAAPEDATAVQQPVAPPPPPAPPYAAAQPPAPPVAPYQSQPGWQQQPPPGPVGMPAAQTQAYPQTSNNAVVALILGIVAWLVCPIILAIVSLVFASKADKEIKASNGWLTGHGMVLAAKILSWINIGFYILLGLFFLIVFIVAAASGGLDPDTFPSYESSFSFGA
ncbi:MAG: hypothetical protein QG597_2938 [Actinomycetota bacterium]|nr:hypothetical protein [Actinomycetota bacterium]